MMRLKYQLEKGEIKMAKNEMIEAEALVNSYLPNCRYSHLTSEEALDLSARDDRFRVKRIAGV